MWKFPRYPRVCLALVVLTQFGCSDYLPFSGAELEGEVAELPTNFAEIELPDIVQLETNPQEPYSVNIWVVGREKHLYVFAGDNRSQWIEHMEADPRVRLKVGTSIYELAAERVTEAYEFESFAQSWEEKYGNRPRNESVTETWLMRLTPRASNSASTGASIGWAAE